MKKRKIAVLIGLFACALCAAGLAACGHEHTYAEEWTTDATHHWHEATCEHTGEKDGYAEHTWDGGTVTTAATCTEAGEKTYTCTVCSATKTEPIPATGHSWNGGTVTTAATCTEAGEKTYTCTVCSATKTEVIAATGHTYAEEWSSDNTHHWHEATCGHDVKEDYAEHVFEKGVCITCGCTQPVTEGLEYTLINNDTEYEVSGYGMTIGSEIFIPSAHNGLPVTSIGPNAFSECEWIKSVFIPDSITSIGDYAFEECYSLTSIVIPDSVTSIGDGAFGDCDSLTSIIIPESVTSIGDFVFDRCDNLASITVAEGNSVYHSAGNCLIETASKTLIAGCKTSVIPADGSVTIIGTSAFIYCDGLTSVIIPDSVTSIGSSAFSGCDSLTSVTIGSGVQSIGSSAFSYCYKLLEVYNKSELSITAGGTDHGYVALYAMNVYTQEGGSKLTDTSDGYRFFYDGSKGYLVGYHGTQTALTLPASFTAYNGTLVEKYEIAERAFYGCTALKSVTIPESVTVIGDNAFADCTSLTSVIIPDSVTSIGDYAFYSCENLTSVIIPDSVTSIGDYAFYSCENLTSVIIPDSVMSIGIAAFYGCENLTSVTIGSGVTSIGDYAFENCYKLVEVYNKSALSIKAGGTAHGEVAYYARNVYTQEGGSQLTDTSDGYRFFYDGSKGYLVGYYGTDTALTLPASFTAYDGTLVEKYEIAERAFYNCTALKSVTIPESVTGICDYAFTYCEGLTSIIIPNSVTSIGNEAFEYCNSLTSVTIGSGVQSIGVGAFAFCTGLTSVTIGSGVTSIGEGAFAYCNSLTSVTIGSGVTSIGDFAFAYCNSLTSIIIPESVTSIGDMAFADCNTLEAVYYCGTATQWQAVTIGSDPFVSTTTVYCYSETPPTDTGNYWHFDTDDVTPVKW